MNSPFDGQAGEALVRRPVRQGTTLAERGTHAGVPRRTDATVRSTIRSGWPPALQAQLRGACLGERRSGGLPERHRWRARNLM